MANTSTHTKSSSALEENAGFIERSMVAGPLGGDADLTRAIVEPVFSLLSRKGFRDVGLSGAVVDCMLKPALTGEGRLFAGDAVRLRNGLFEGRVVAMPGEGCLTGSTEVSLVLAAVEWLIAMQRFRKVCRFSNRRMKQANWRI